MLIAEIGDKQTEVLGRMIALTSRDFHCSNCSLLDYDDVNSVGIQGST